MPTTPSADPTQKALLENLKNLSQTDVVNTSNQITFLNKKIAEYQHGQELFQDRYDYWDDYIIKYEVEKKYLTGNHISSPIVTADFTSFLTKTGRLYNASLPVPDRFAPYRITEFDGGGTTYVSSDDEKTYSDLEVYRRGDLYTGISNPSFPNTVKTNETLHTGQTSLLVSSLVAVSIPTGVRVIVQSSYSSAIIYISNVTDMTPPTPQPPTQYIYNLDIVLDTPTFSAIGANNYLYGSVVFNNTERTNKTASTAGLQPVLNGMIANYQSALTQWQSNLQNQRNAILAETKEDQPDQTYVDNQKALIDSITNYLVTTDVSNTGLTYVQGLSTTRTTAKTNRISWIANRLTSTTAYDSRWKYGDRLYNLTDGSIKTINVLTAQRDALTAQQSSSAARAAKYSNEIF